MIQDDPYNLQRFVEAQNPIYLQICSELRAGFKRSHWMWFVFPQIKGLGHSYLAEKYAISCREEAKSYLAHNMLGTRLRECVDLVNEVNGRSAKEIFGYPDYLKFRSSMTLFANVMPENRIFIDAIDKYFPDGFDQATLKRLK